MWNVDKDPLLSSTFGSVTLLDCAPDMDVLADRLLAATRVVPRLRQRVVPVLGRLAPPLWQYDPDFDLDWHLRRVALPGPGSLTQLHDLAAAIVADAFDRSRPLWQFWIVEGLADGRTALVQKMHHTITDGEGGIRMSMTFIDTSRHPAQPPAGASHTVTGGPSGGVRTASVSGTSLAQAARTAAGHGLRRGAGMVGRSVGMATNLVRSPHTAITAPVRQARAVRSALSQVTVSPRPHSPLWTQRSLARSFSTLDVDLPTSLRAARVLGGSLNDLFVTAVAGAVGAYHRQQGAPVASMRMAMPVSTRHGRRGGGNAFVPTRVLVPTGAASPRERFAEVHAALDVTKREPMLGMVEGVAGAVNLLPTSVVVRLVRQQVSAVDFTTSNVRAAPFPLYMAGARVEETYPLGPLVGTSFNVTLMSYEDTANIGLHVDTAAVGDPELLRACIIAEFARLLAHANSNEDA
jgi:WS/DGAT/MGAT family acyltransferase